MPWAVDCRREQAMILETSMGSNTRSQQMNAFAKGLGGILAVGLFLGACAPPKGEPSGRVEVTDTTPAERNSPQIQLSAQHEFSDRVAQQLAADLSSVPALNQDYRVTIVFGDIVNQTGIVPTTEFEAFRMRVRQKLMQSQHVLRNVRFVENRARLEELRRREMGNSGDLLQQGSQPAAPALNPRYTFFLNGNMYRAQRGAGRGEVNEYLMSYQLTSAETGEIVWENVPYDIKQVR
jgi:PBP1b-binding outer membrane lipoprotein LpoB